MLTLQLQGNIDPAENVAVYREYCRFGKAESFLHSHEFIEIVYCFEGNGIQIVGDHEYKMERGSILFLNYGQSHSFYSDSVMGYYNFLLLPSFISESLINTVDAFSFLTLAAFSDFDVQDPAPILRMTGKEMLEVENIAERMEHEFDRKETGYRAALLGYITVLFSKIFRKMSLPAETDNGVSKRNITPEIISYIENHLNEKLTLAELACRSFYNPSYFSRIFKEYSGQSLSDFIHRKRVERALDMLKKTDLTVEQVGFAVGFSDKKQFYRQFKNYMGITPGSVKNTK